MAKVLKRVHSFDLNYEQFMRVQNLVACKDDRICIWHMIYDDATEHFVTLIECDDRMATWIELQ